MAKSLGASELTCNGWREGARCAATNLCRAHIIPRGFARAARGGRYLLSITDDGIKKPGAQDGVYDGEILCQSCDGVLGDFDKYAIEFCKALSSVVVERDGYWEVTDADGDKLAKFVLAVLWRASLSKRSDFAEISLGTKYEPRAREVLYGFRPLSSLPEFEVLLSRLRTTGADMNGFFTLPERMSGTDYRCYGFIVGGLHVCAKLDNRRFPAHWAEMVVNGRSAIRGLNHRFEDTSQFRALANQILRRARPT